MKLRSYQSAAVDAVFQYWREGGGSPLLDLATGLGKSVIIAKLIQEIGTRYPDMRILVLVHVQELVEQDFTALIRLWPQASAGIYSAGLGRRDAHHRITFASIQSVFRKGRDIGPRDLVLIDEAHLVPKAGEGMYLTLLEALRDVTPDLRVAGLTATAFRLDSGRLDQGEGRLFDQIVYHYGVGEGVEDGWLAPLTCRAASIEIDVSDVAKRGGEFVAGALEAAADKDELTRAAVAEIMARAGDRQSWLIFCSGVKHAQHVCTALNAEGVPCGVVTGETPKEIRRQLIADFKRGKLRALTNAQVLTTGFDAPQTDLIAFLRPTLSTGLYVQMCLDEETEILSERGWLTRSQIQKTDLVAGFDVSTEEIRWQGIEEIVERPLAAGEKMLGVQSPHIDFRVTDQHNLVVACRTSRIKRADKPSWRLEMARDTATRRDNVLLPVAGQMVVPGASLSDAEISFLGWFLSDGTLSRANNAITIAQSVESQQNIHIAATLDDCGFRFGYHVTKRDNDYAALGRYSVSFGDTRIPNGTGSKGWGRLKDWINAEKILGPAFDLLDRRQMLILLDALNRGDGHKFTTATWEPATYSITCGKNRAMADRLQALCVTRGIRCNITNTDPSNIMLRACPSKTRAVIGGTRGDDKPRSAIKLMRGEERERVWCVRTPMGTIVTRRRGKVMIMGNCGRGTRPVWPAGFDPNAHSQEERLAAIAGSSKANCLVLDFAGNVRRHGPVDAVIVRDKKEKGAAVEIDDPDLFKVKVDSVRSIACVECSTYSPIGTKICADCGHVFPEPERKIKHEKRPEEDVAVLARDLKPVQTIEYPVVRWLAGVHQKLGATNTTMRVSYYAGLMEVPEWVAFEHTGFARTKAEKWWHEHGGSFPAPRTTEEAIRRFEAGEVKMPRAIFTRKEDGWDRIVGRRFAEEAA